jgi:hypothetical protein
MISKLMSMDIVEKVEAYYRSFELKYTPEFRRKDIPPPLDEEGCYSYSLDIYIKLRDFIKRYESEGK